MTLGIPTDELIDLSDLVHDHDDTAGDVGSELVDLPDDLALTAAEVTTPWDEGTMSLGGFLTLMAPPGFAQSVSPVKAASWAQYEWMSWAADVLRAAGCTVVEHPGWQTRGRPRSVGRFQPRGLLWHHDASKAGPSPYVAKFLAEQGRPDEGIPAPLSQFWVCMGCKGAHPVGTWHVLAAGRCNHAGTGAGFGKIGEDAGAAVTAGVETDNTTGEATPPAMYASLVRGSAALMKRMRSDPAGLLAGHKEYARGRKVDPDDIDMSKARRDVAAAMRGPVKPTPPPPVKPPVDVKPPKPPAADVPLVPYPGGKAFRLGRRHKAVTQLDRWLIDVDCDKHHDGNGYQAGPRFTIHTLRNVADFQRSQEKLKVDPDGYPGPLTWNILQLRARIARARSAAARD